MNILVVTYSHFPEGDAEAVRLLTFGKLLKEMGNDVFFVGMGHGSYLEVNEYQGFQYTTLRKKARNHIERIFYYINYKKRLQKYLNLYLQQHSIDILLIADLSPFVTMWLKKFCEANHIQLIADSVEWYSPAQFKFGIFSPSMLLKNFENRFVLNKKVKIISISRYLQTHFLKRGCKTARIPVILDIKNMKYQKEPSHKLTLLYAGSPGKKDYVVEMLNGVLLLSNNEMDRIQFIFAGVRYDQIKPLFSEEELKTFKKCVDFLGRVKRNEVLQLLTKVDFTVLLRSADERYAKAGFPTKVVESLATATPVILNLSSDLEDYINDLDEGLIVKECSAEAFAQTIKRALHLNEEQLSAMKQKARLCAETHFDYRLYQHQLSHLIDWKNDPTCKN